MLRDGDAGPHELVFDLYDHDSKTDVDFVTQEVDVGCTDEFILDESGHRCVCDVGSFLDFATGKCKVCPIGRFRDTPGATSQNDCWTCERYLGGEVGSSTKTTGSTSFDDCVCPSGFHSSFFPDQSRAGWTVDEEDIGSCEECPLGGVCRVKNIELNVTFGVDVDGIYVLPGFWRNSEESEWLYPCKDAAKCVGSGGMVFVLGEEAELEEEDEASEEERRRLDSGYPACTDACFASSDDAELIGNGDEYCDATESLFSCIGTACATEDASAMLAINSMMAAAYDCSCRGNCGEDGTMDEGSLDRDEVRRFYSGTRTKSRSH